VHVARLSALAALHDAGKVNHGFQNWAFDDPGPRNGHVVPIVEVLESEKSGEYLMALGIAPMLDWFSADQLRLEHFLLATFGHHGRPVLPESNFKSKLWEKREDEQRNPVSELKRLADYVQQWFPAAFDEADPFPADPPLQHAFNGVLTLADWIGSDQRFFDFAEDNEDPMPRARGNAAGAVEKLFLDPSSARETLGDAPIGFDGVLADDGWTPHDIQQATLDLDVHENGSLTVLESDTGSGKTEAAIARFIRLYQANLVDGMYFAVPTRAAATQLHGRVKEAIGRLFVDGARPPVVQAVPGYIKADENEATRLPSGFEVHWDEDNAMKYRGWAAEHPKHYLAGPIVVGTVDQVLLSVLQANHAHLRAGALLRHFLVIDEVHASDVYMTALMDRVLDQHLAAGGHALLMSATLGSAARTHLTTAGQGDPPAPEDAEQEDYPLLTHVDASRTDPEQVHAASSGKQKTVETKCESLADDSKTVAAFAIEKARAGARVLVIRNLVRDCQDTQCALEEAVGDDTDLLFGIGDTRAPHHSRFAPADRKRLDDRIEAVFGKERDGSGGIVTVATQTVEQSLDIDADLLVTDLCPMDVLLQRIGRLHRHDRDRPDGFETARCVVLTPEGRDLSTLIKGKEARGPHGLTDKVYGDLRVIEATWRVLEAGSSDDGEAWRIPADNRRLVERTTHPERLRAITEAGGEAWTQHQQHIHGVRLGDLSAADIRTIDRSEPFGECRFDEDSTPKTRLGEDDYRVELPESESGPFGASVGVLTIAAWRFHETPDAVETGDATAEDVQPFEGGFSFSFGGKRFRYDRMGLAETDKGR
jgi:CRISPR-associated endonuclease/helicase Cas3